MSDEEPIASSEVQPTQSTPLIYSDDDFDPVYLKKARILNDAIQEIGMGRYQV